MNEALRCRQPEPVDDTTVQTLWTRGYLTDKTHGEECAYVAKLTAWLHSRALSHARPGYILVPTYQCNLRCPYCFEASTRTSLAREGRLDEVMSVTAADNAFRAMDELNERHKIPAMPSGNGQRRHPIGLYGGEPLMRSTLPVIEHIVEMGRRRETAFTATTNGVDLACFIHLLGPGAIERIQLTLDGPRAVHNRKRVGRAHPEGTYDIILGSIGLALSKGTAVSVRIHFDQNHHRAEEILRDLENRGYLRDRRFHVYAESTHSWSKGFAVPTFPDLARDRLREAVSRIEQSSDPGLVRLTASDLGMRDKLASYVRNGLAGICPRIEACCSQLGMYVLDPFGRIYACWELIGRPEGEIGHFSQAGVTLHDGEKAWRGRSPALIPECASCKYALLHFGGCSAISVATHGALLSSACYDYEASFAAVGTDFLHSLSIQEGPNEALPHCEPATAERR